MSGLTCSACNKLQWVTTGESDTYWPCPECGVHNTDFGGALDWAEYSRRRWGQ